MKLEDFRRAVEIGCAQQNESAVFSVFDEIARRTDEIAKILYPTPRERREIKIETEKFPDAVDRIFDGQTPLLRCVEEMARNLEQGDLNHRAIYTGILIAAEQMTPGAKDIILNELFKHLGGYVENTIADLESRFHLESMRPHRHTNNTAAHYSSGVTPG